MSPCPVAGRDVRARSACSAPAAWAGIASRLSALCRAARVAENPTLLTFEIRLALFEEGLDAFPRILGLRHQEELSVQVMKRGAEVHVLLAVEGIAAQPHRDRGLLRQLVRDLLDGGVELLKRHDPV